jgi:hypothetical protein
MLGILIHLLDPIIAVGMLPIRGNAILVTRVLFLDITFPKGPPPRTYRPTSKTRASW